VVAHLAKAEESIAAADKAAALAANAEAAALLPSDQRVLDQRAKIDAMVDPNAAQKTSTIPAAPNSLTVSRKQGETAAERESRDKNARYHLADGIKAYQERNWQEAIDKLGLALAAAEREDYGNKPNEAQDLRQSAKTHLADAAAQAAQAARADAQKLLAEAKVLAGSNVPAAYRKLREAQARDPQTAGADALLKTLQDSARVIGEDALGDAKNLENKRLNAEAIRAYERALDHLQLIPGHPEVATAKEKLAILRAPK
jgi:hypothetical protein